MTSESNDPSTDICFVVPAFDSLRHAPLGTSILITACRARGFRVGAVFASLMLGARIGFDLYDRISGMLPTRQPGEYLFKPFAYPPEVLKTIPTGVDSPKARAVIAPASPAIGPHLEEVVAAIAARRPRIVAITNTFQQSLAGFSLARRVRAALPEALIVMGGANVAGVMARGLAQVFDCVDHFFDGEGDIVFPDFCESYLRHGLRPDERVVPCAPVMDMDAVPAPDFSDFAAALHEHQAAGRLPRDLPLFATYESSRGCWWGAKHHCTFCGLNAESMAFREKRTERIVEELDALASQWPGRVIRTADNIMPMSFFDGVLPQLERLERRPRLFYEVKSNLKDAQIQAMLRAGIYSIQPGIESLSTPVLRLMRKGVSAHQNISLLRMCTTHGMKVGWNLIYGFPGETCESYREMLALVPSLVHLAAPDGFSPIMLDRFSPYLNDHASFGIPSIRPFEAYQGLYPADAPLDDIAYHFWGVYTTPFLDDAVLRGEFSEAVKRWRSLWNDQARRPRLEIVSHRGKPLVVDTRGFAANALTVLPGDADQALRYFEQPRPSGHLPPSVAPHVEELLARRFIVEHEGLLLSLVVRRHEVAAELPALQTVPPVSQLVWHAAGGS